MADVFTGKAINNISWAAAAMTAPVSAACRHQDSCLLMGRSRTCAPPAAGSQRDEGRRLTDRCGADTLASSILFQEHRGLHAALVPSP